MTAETIKTSSSKTPADIQVEGTQGLYKRGKAYRYQRMANGKMIRRSLGSDLNLARAEADRMNYMLNAGEDLSIEVTAQKKRLTELFEEVVELSINVRPSTRKRYRAVKDNFLFWCQEKGFSKVADIQPDHIDAYLKDRSSQPIIPNDHEIRGNVRPICIHGASEKTLVFEKTYLSRVFEHAVTRDWIRKNPVKKSTVLKNIKKKQTDISLRSFTRDEVSRLIAAAATIGQSLRSLGNCTWQEVLSFFFMTGLRENELLNLQWSDVYWNESEFGAISLTTKDFIESISLEEYEDAAEIIQEHMKNKGKKDAVFTPDELSHVQVSIFPIRSKTALAELKCEDIKTENGIMSIVRKVSWLPKASTGFVPLSKNARAILDTLADRTGKKGFVFASINGGKIRTNLLPIFKRTVEAAKIDIGNRNLTLHSTRHTFGCMLRDNNVPLETIMGLMRHSDIKETLRYAPYTLPEGAKAVQKLDF